MSVPTLFEIENGEGNGVIHWYCSEQHRDLETIDYGEVDPLDVDIQEVPSGTICEFCSVELV